jgi:hypothetical protein
MERSRRRIAAIALLICLPAMTLAALPAFGLHMDAVRRPVAQFAQKSHGHDAVWTGGIQITGNVQSPLSPGMSSPISVRINNPNPRTVAMQRVRVKIAGITAPHADATHRCTRVDFEIHQMPRLALRVPAGRVTDLAGLGLPVTSWPTLAMRNLPTNQDGCKGATVTLRFRTASLNRPTR